MSLPLWMSREMVSSTLSPLFLIVSETWRGCRGGGFMERSHGRCDEHYPVIMKGTQLYCQSLQTGGRVDLAGLLGGVCPFMRLYSPYIFIRRAGQIGIFIYLHRVSGVIALSRRSLHSRREMPRANQVRCASCQCHSPILNCVLKIFGCQALFLIYLFIFFKAWHVWFIGRRIRTFWLFMWSAHIKNICFHMGCRNRSHAYLIMSEGTVWKSSRLTG